MAAPSVLTRQTSVSSTTDATTFTPTLPTVTTGKFLLAVVSIDGNPTLSTTSTGWTKYGQASDATNNVTQAIFFKRYATGSDTLVVNSTVSQQYSAVIFCIDAGTYPAIYAGSFATGSSTNSNPPSTNTMLARDILWIATRSGDSTVVATVAPSSFSNLQSQAAGGTSGASTNTAERSLTATALLDPGTFTSATEQWVSATIAIWADVDPLANWVAARNHATNNARIFCVGDSWTAGWVVTNNTGPVYLGNSRSISWPTVIANNWQAFTATSDNWFGDGGAGVAAVTKGTYDTRVVPGGTWDTSNPTDPSTTAGGGAFRASTASQTLSFTPSGTFDRIEVHASAYSGSGTNLVNVDGGSSLGTLAQNASDAYLRPTFNVSLATHTINIVGNSGTLGYITGTRVWKSGTKQIEVLNAGWYGSHLTDWVVDDPNLPNPLNVIRTFTCHLVINALVANDVLDATAQATVLADCRLINLVALSTGASVMQITPFYLNSSTVAQATQTAYHDLCIQAANELNCAAYRVTDRTNWTTHAAAVSAGYISADDIHPTTTGYADLAAMIRPLVDVTGGAGSSTGTGAVTGIGSGIFSGAGAATGTGAASGIAPAAGSAGSAAGTSTAIAVPPNVIFRSMDSSGYSGAGRTDTTIPKPAGTVSGDVMVAVIWAGQSGTGAPGIVVTPPAGWSAISASTNTFTAGGVYYSGMRAFYKVAGGSEGSSYTFSHAFADADGCIQTYIGADPSTPIGPVTGKNGNQSTDGQTPTITTVTPTVGNSMVLFNVAGWSGANTSAAPTGTTPTYTTRYNSGDPTFQGLYTADGPLVGLTATGADSISVPGQGTTDPWFASAIVVQPPTPGATTASGAGAATGTGATTGVGASAAASAGTATGTGATTGVGAARFVGAGASAGTGATSGVGASIFSGVGAATGTGATTGVGASRFAAAGSAAGTGATTGVGAANDAAAGSAVGAGASSAAGNAVTPGAGSAAGSGGTTGVGASIFAAVGSAPGTGAAQGYSSAAGTGVATGVGAGLGAGATFGTGAGNAAGTGAAAARTPSLGAGSAPGVGGTTGVGGALIPAFGFAVGTGAGTGVGANISASAGSSTGASTCTAVGASNRAGAGSATGTGVGTGVGAGGDASTGAATGSGAAQGAGAAIDAAAGSATGTSTAQGISLAGGVGNAAGSGVGSGAGAARFAAAGTATATTTANGYSVASGAGSAAGSGTCSGFSSANSNGAGTATGIGGTTGVGQGVISGAGAATGLGAGSGVGASNSAAQGSAQGIGAGQGVGASHAAAAGSAAGTSSASGVSAGGVSSGLAVGSSAASGAGTALTPAAGFAAGTGAASAGGYSVAASAGTTAGTGVAAGTGTSITSGSGISFGTSTSSGAGAAIFAGSGLASGSGLADGRPFFGSQGTSNGSGDASGAGQGNAAIIGIAIGSGSASGGGDRRVAALTRTVTPELETRVVSAMGESRIVSRP